MKRTLSTLKQVLSRLGRGKWLLLLTLLCSAGSVLLSLYIPILVGRAIDCIVEAGQVDFAALAPLLSGIAVCAALSAALGWGLNAAGSRMTLDFVASLRSEVFARMQKLPLSFFDSHPAGDLLSRMTSDADAAADGLLMGFTQLFTGCMTILVTLIFMLTIEPLIALLVVVLTPLSLFAAKFIASRTHSMFQRQSELRGKQTAFTDEVIGGMKVVQAFSVEEAMQERFADANGKLAEVSLRAIFFSSITNPTTRFVNNFIYAVVGLCGALTVLGGGGMTVGGLSSFLSYANQYTKPFNEISGVIAELQNALACARRLTSLLEEETEASDASLPALPMPRGEVTLRDVTFSYLPEKPLIEGLSLSVKPGMRVAIVGKTGCGKTTLINLLMRFYEVQGGGIDVDGTDIRSVTRESLRRGYGMVLQDTWLCEGTVRDNLTFACPDATEEEIVAAAKRCHADGFIRRLPQGYDTVLRGSGSSLSEGQRQLLCITRVMLARPSMLILDEATSSIDLRTEQKVQRAFSTLMEGRTSFIVAHRLSTIQNADLILVMDKGKVVERGTHETLLAADGFYARLYGSQFA